jgi:flagellar protein FliO/FliZ
MASGISTVRRISCLALLLPALAHAEAVAMATDTAGGVGQLLFGFAVVIALLFASLWLLKRLSAPRGQAAGLLRVIAGTAVGARERVVIVEVGGSWLVLGVAPGQVTTLAEIPRSSLPARPDQSDTRDFSGWLRRTLNRTDAT